MKWLLGLLIMLTPACALAKDQPIYVDQDGLIIHKGHCFFNDYGVITNQATCDWVDGGDTAAREGWYWFGKFLRERTPGVSKWPNDRRLTFEQVLDKLEPHHDGIFYRHPNLKEYNNPYDVHYGTSRDQLIPLIAAMGLAGNQQARLMRLWNALPEDKFGKHSFQDNWTKFSGGPGENCREIDKQACPLSTQCNFNIGLPSCSTPPVNLNCPALVDIRSCPHIDPKCMMPAPLPGGIHPPIHLPQVPDPSCPPKVAVELACIAARVAATNGLKPQRAACELAQTAAIKANEANDAICKTSNTAVGDQIGKVTLLCKAVQLGNPCVAYREARHQLCLMTNYNRTDLFGPEYVNLFKRALGRNPFLPVPELMVPGSVLTPVELDGHAGEINMQISAKLRIDASVKDVDDSGPDLNMIVELLMAQATQSRWPSPIAAAAAHMFATTRLYSHGSFLGRYYAKYGAPLPDPQAVPIPEDVHEIDQGIAQGWKPDASRLFGGVKWYHRATTGGNPALAAMYAPLIDYYLK